MTARQAANKMGVTLDAVYRLVWAGKLKAERNVDHDWNISEKDVNARITAKRKLRAKRNRKLARTRTKVKVTVAA